MKKKIILGIFVTIFAGFFLVNIAWGDSGWDTSYDSGSSSSWSSSDSGWSSSSSSWDYDSSSSYSHDYSSSSSSSKTKSGYRVFMRFLEITFWSMVFVYIMVNGVGRKKSGKIYYDTQDFYYDMNIDELKQILPNETLDSIKEMAYNKFISVQNAWMNFDYEQLKKDCSDELYNSYHEQLEVLKSNGQKNIMSDFSIMNIRVISAKKDNKTISVQVFLKISFYDYVVDSLGITKQGSDNTKIVNRYVLTFTKGYSDKANTCPNCGANLDGVTTKSCPYCRSKIAVVSNEEFVLSKKVNEGTTLMR